MVATGGESVSGRSGSVWIDDKYRLIEDEYRAIRTDDFDAVKVPEGSVFVLSDDRQYGEDSREEDIGCVSLDDIVGVMHIKLLPSFQIYK